MLLDIHGLLNLDGTQEDLHHIGAKFDIVHHWLDSESATPHYYIREQQCPSSSSGFDYLGKTRAEVVAVLRKQRKDANYRKRMSKDIFHALKNQAFLKHLMENKAVDMMPWRHYETVCTQIANFAFEHQMDKALLENRQVRMLALKQSRLQRHALREVLVPWLAGNIDRPLPSIKQSLNHFEHQRHHKLDALQLFIDKLQALLLREEPITAPLREQLLETLYQALAKDSEDEAKRIQKYRKLLERKQKTLSALLDFCASEQMYALYLDKYLLAFNGPLAPHSLGVYAELIHQPLTVWTHKEGGELKKKNQTCFDSDSPGQHVAYTLRAGLPCYEPLQPVSITEEGLNTQQLNALIYALGKRRRVLGHQALPDFIDDESCRYYDEQLENIWRLDEAHHHMHINHHGDWHTIAVNDTADTRRALQHTLGEQYQWLIHQRNELALLKTRVSYMGESGTLAIKTLREENAALEEQRTQDLARVLGTTEKGITTFAGIPPSMRTGISAALLTQWIGTVDPQTIEATTGRNFLGILAAYRDMETDLKSDPIYHCLVTEYHVSSTHRNHLLLSAEDLNHSRALVQLTHETPNAINYVQWRDAMDSLTRLRDGLMLCADAMASEKEAIIARKKRARSAIRYLTSVIHKLRGEKGHPDILENHQRLVLHMADFMDDALVSFPVDFFTQVHRLQERVDRHVNVAATRHLNNLVSQILALRTRPEFKAMTEGETALVAYPAHTDTVQLLEQFHEEMRRAQARADKLERQKTIAEEENRSLKEELEATKTKLKSETQTCEEQTQVISELVRRLEKLEGHQVNQDASSSSSSSEESFFSGRKQKRAPPPEENESDKNKTNPRRFRICLIQ